MNIENIAKEPFETIASYLSLYEVVQLSLTNKKIHNSVSRLTRWVDFSAPKEEIRSFTVKNPTTEKKAKTIPKEHKYAEKEEKKSDKSPAEKKSAILHKTKLLDIPFLQNGVLETLDLYGIVFNEGAPETLFQILLSDKFPNLSKVNIAENCTYKKAAKRKKNWTPPMAKPTKLTVLNLAGTSWDFPQFSFLLSLCPSLKVFIGCHIHVSGSNDGSFGFFNACPQLETIDISYSTFTRENRAPEIFSSFENLSNLKIVYAVGFNLKEAGKISYKLITTELWEEEHINEKDFIEVVDYITNPNVNSERIPFFFYVAGINLNCAKLLLKNQNYVVNTSIKVNQDFKMDPWKPQYPCPSNSKFADFTPDGSSIFHYAIIKSINIFDLIKILPGNYQYAINTRNRSKITPLAMAIIYNRSDVVLDLMAAGANPNSANSDGWTPLHFAASTCDDGDVDIISLLLQHKADINAITNSGDSVLDIACYRNATQTVKALLQAGASTKSQQLVHYYLDGKPAPKSSPKATKEKSPTKEPRKDVKTKKAEIKPEDVLDVLLQINYDFGLVNSLGLTPLLIAINDINNFDQVFKILSTESGRKSVNHAVNGQTVAANTEDIRCAQILLERGADVDSNVDGLTPLWVNCAVGDGRLVPILIKYGANVNQTDVNGWSCLHLLAEKDLTSPLINVANINITDKCNVTPILTASYASSWNIMKQLLDRGAKTNHINTFDGKCILHNMALCNRDAELINRVIKQTKDLVNHQDYFGNTPLHYAVAAGNYECITDLLANGARTDIQNKIGNIPMMNCFIRSFKTNPLTQIKTVNGWQYTYPVWLNTESFPATTPFELQNNYKIYKELLNSTKDLTIRNKDGNTLLHILIHHIFEEGKTHGTLKLLEKLLKSPIVNIKNNKGNTPLLECLKLSKNERYGEMEDIIETIVAAGADVNVSNEDGTVAIHECISIILLKIISKAANFNINLQNRNGETILHICLRHSSHFRQFGLIEIINKIIELGGDCNLLDNTGSSPLHIVCQAGISMAVKRMLQSPNINPRLPNSVTGQMPADLAITTMFRNESPSSVETVVLLLPFMEEEQKGLFSKQRFARLLVVTEDKMKESNLNAIYSLSGALIERKGKAEKATKESKGVKVGNEMTKLVTQYKNLFDTANQNAKPRKKGSKKEAKNY